MSTHTKITRLGGLLLLAGCISLSMGTLAWSDDDEYWGGNKYNHERGEGGWQRATGVAPVANKQYQDECAACHFAYPAGFLPARSWVKIMGNLDDHFGENASLDGKSRAAIEQYLRANAADRAPVRFSRSFMRSIGNGETPLRISETGYFRHKHREIPARMIKGNPKVRSLSNCTNCHTGADKGWFDEDSVFIPGFGRWDD